MSLNELKSQIATLELQEQRELKTFLEELEADAWDAQIEADAKAGRLDHLFEEAEKEYAAGLGRPLKGSLKEAFKEYQATVSEQSVNVKP